MAVIESLAYIWLTIGLVIVIYMTIVAAYNKVPTTAKHLIKTFIDLSPMILLWPYFIIKEIVSLIRGI